MKPLPRRRRFENWLEWRVAPLFQMHPTIRILPFAWIPLVLLVVVIFHSWLRFYVPELMGVLACSFGFIVLLRLAWWAGDREYQRERERVRRLRKLRICIHCGYDLRASSGRCPECGNRNTPPDR